ncbi:MAG: hypothetical protein AAGI13_03760 [Pseudomonadota bacterium]
MQRFQSFRDHYKPLIRPEGMIERTHGALQLGPEFSSRFALIRRQMHDQIEAWPERIVLSLLTDPAAAERMGEAELAMFRQLYSQHIDSLMGARFTHEYYDTLEDNALFFLYLGLPQTTVMWAIKTAIMRSIEALYDRHGPSHKLMALMTMVDLLMLEMNQTQRVFILYSQAEAAGEQTARVLGRSGGAPSARPGARPAVQKGSPAGDERGRKTGTGRGHHPHGAPDPKPDGTPDDGPEGNPGGDAGGDVGGGL